MSMRRSLALLLSCYLACWMCCGAVFASDYTVLDDLPISPEDELTDMEGWLAEDPTQRMPDQQSAGSVQASDEADAAGGDDAIMPLVDMDVSWPSTTWWCRVNSGSFVLTATGEQTGITNSSVFNSHNSYVFNRTNPSGSGYYGYSFSPGSTACPPGNRSVSYRVSSENAVVDVWTDVDLPDNVETILVYPPVITSNSDGFILYCGVRENTSFGSILGQISPQWYRLMVNGQVYGDRHSFGSFSGDLIDVVSLGSQVRSIGWRFEFGNQTMLSSVMVSQYPVGYFMIQSSVLLNGFFYKYETGNAGLIGSIIEWLQKILTGITNIGNSIIALPGKLVTLLVDALKSLFIPDQATIQAIFAKYDTLLETKLGFIWQIFKFLEDAIEGLVSAFTSGSAYQFTFPGVSLELSGETFEIIPETPVSLDNAFMSVVRPVLGTIFSFCAVVYVFNKAEDMVIALVSGASYFSWHNLSNLDKYVS